MANFKVGVAQVDFTPEIGLPMMGHCRDDFASRGVHDPLYAQAIVIESADGNKVALCSLPLNMANRSNMKVMRDHIAANSDLLAENVFISTTHSHAGPAPFKVGMLPVSPADVADAFLVKASTSVIEANKKLKDADFAVGYNSEERVSFNRRLKCKDGETHMNWESPDPDFVERTWGPIDPELVTITVNSDDGPEAAIVNFALHVAIIGADNWLYSACYPGYIAEAMRKFFGKDFLTCFLGGCSGNLNHLDYTDPVQGDGYKYSQFVGYTLAADAFEGIRSQQVVQGGELAVSKEFVQLGRVQISDEKYEWAKEVMEKAKTKESIGIADGLPDEYYGQMYLDLYEKQGKDDNVEVMVMRIGDLGIVGLPGEMFCELGMDIKEKSPAKHTIVVELANDAAGYFPNEEAFDQGGYEPSMGSTMYLAGAGEKLAASAVAQLKELFKK